MSERTTSSGRAAAVSNVPVLWRVLVPVGLAIVVGALVARFYGPLAGGGLGLIDDHEIIRFLGSDHRVGVEEIPGLLISRTEVGGWGTSTRFRPVYYLWRLVETAAFGDRAGAWYLARMAYIGAVAWTLGLIGVIAATRLATSRVRGVLGVAFGAGISMAVISLGALPDSIMRLGPSEIYVGVGIAIAAAGAAAVWRGRGGSAAWIVAATGVVVAVGSKEDAVLLVVPLTVVAVILVPSSRGQVTTLISMGVAVAFAAFVALGIVIGVVRKGSDMYGENRTVGDWLALIPGNLFVATTVLCLVVCVVLEKPAGDLTVGSGRVTRARAWLRNRPHVLLAAIAVFVVIGDLYFYQNSFDANIFLPARYGFLTDLAVVLAAATAVHLLLIRGAEWRPSLRAGVAAGTIALLLASPIGGQISGAFAGYRGAAAGVVLDQQRFRAQLDDGIAALGAEAQAVVLANSARDYERSLSFSAFLRYYGDAPPIFLRVVAPAGAVVDAQDRTLLSDLDTASRDGDERWGIGPIAQLQDDRPTVCFAFVAEPNSTSGCDAVRVIG